MTVNFMRRYDPSFDAFCYTPRKGLHAAPSGALDLAKSAGSVILTRSAKLTELSCPIRH